MDRITLPERILSLTETQHPDCYRQASDAAGYELTDEARDHIQRANADLTKIEAEHAAKVEEMDSKIRRDEAALGRLLKQRDVMAALADAGVPPKLRPGACAAILEDLDIKLEKSDGAHQLTVAGPYGVMTVAQAVGGWLSSEQGAGFVKQIAPTQGEEPGPFELAIKRMAGGEAVH